MFAEAAAAIGHDQLEFDPGRHRPQRLPGKVSARRAIPAGPSLLRVVDPAVRGTIRNRPPRGRRRQQWQRAGWLRIRFSGSPGSYIHYSYCRAGTARCPPRCPAASCCWWAPPRCGHGRVGADTPTSGLSADAGHQLPGQRLRRPAPGRRSIRCRRGSPGWWPAMMVGGLMLVLLYADARIGLHGILRPRRRCAAAGGARPAPGRLVVRAGIGGGSAACWPIPGSWRRLEATQRYLDAELIALERERLALGLARRFRHRGAADPLEARIRIVARWPSTSGTCAASSPTPNTAHRRGGDRSDQPGHPPQRARPPPCAPSRSEALLSAPARPAVAALRLCRCATACPISGFSGIRRSELTPDKAPSCCVGGRAHRRAAARAG